VNKVLAFRAIFRVPLFVFAGVAAAAAALVVLSHSSAAQVGVRISELNCDGDPELVTVVNEGNQEVSMTGWNLQSDPATQESLALASLGVLSPGETLMVESGPSAAGPFIWSQQFLFRDGDPTDFAQLASDAGEVLIKVNCSAAQPTAAATPAQTAAAVQPTAPAPTSTVLPAAAAPVGGGPPGTAAGPIAPVALMLFGSGLLSAGLATFSIPSLLRRPNSDTPDPDASTATMEVPERATSGREFRETESLWPVASTPPIEPTRPVAGGRAVLKTKTSSQPQDSLEIYVGIVVILTVMALLAYLLQGGEAKQE
jgi:hypothetical protein